MRAAPRAIHRPAPPPLGTAAELAAVPRRGGAGVADLIGGGIITTVASLTRDAWPSSARQPEMVCGRALAWSESPASMPIIRLRAKPGGRAADHGRARGAEIDQGRLAFGADEHVGGLYVAVQETRLM